MTSVTGIIFIGVSGEEWAYGGYTPETWETKYENYWQVTLFSDDTPPVITPYTLTITESTDE